MNKSRLVIGIKLSTRVIFLSASLRTLSELLTNTCLGSLLAAVTVLPGAEAVVKYRLRVPAISTHFAGENILLVDH